MTYETELRESDHINLSERIRELEQDDIGWQELSQHDNFQFDRTYLGDLIRLARLMYLKNPLIYRGVNVKADYVFGRRVTINSPDDGINAVLQAFLDDEQNQSEFTAHVMRVQRERELTVDGNIFLVLIPHPVTGHVRVQSLPPEEMVDIIMDPTNRTRPLYYKRQWFARKTELDDDSVDMALQTRYYRDYRNRDDDRKMIGDHIIEDNVYIYHIAVNRFTGWKFGIPEIYAAIDWARAYTKFMENWSTIVAAYARFAWKVTAKSKAGVTAAKTAVATTRTTTVSETNPVPAAGSIATMTSDYDMQPIKTSGATTSAEDGRRLLLMVVASFGLPETFFGDVSVGTLATARSLDRPTELMLTNRQALWADIYHDIALFVLWCAARAQNKQIVGSIAIDQNEYDEEILVFRDPNTSISVTFPSIIEIDPEAEIRAVISAATFDGKTPSVIPDLKMLARMVLTRLGEENIDETLEVLYPGDGPHLPPEPEVPEKIQKEQPLEDLNKAAESLRDAIMVLHESMVPA